MAQYTKTYTFTNGTTADGGQVDTEITALGTSVNNITNDQVDASAGIVYSKLSLADSVQYSDVLSTSFHKARAQRASTQLIGDASSTALSFTSSAFESDSSMWDAGDPTKLICKKAGKYLISGFASFAANTTGIRQFAIKVNGTTDVQSSVSAASADETSQTLCTIKTLAVNDYVQLFVYQNSTGNLNVQAGMHLEMTILA